MTNSIDIDALLNAQPWNEIDSVWNYADSTLIDDEEPATGLLDDALVDVPQAYAAYLDHQQNSWG